MDELKIKGIRCFVSPAPARLAPLTLLVGENSTGKSSFLALTRIAWDIAAGRLPNFNEDPFLLGGFEQISNYRGGPHGRAESFEIATVFKAGGHRLRDGPNIEGWDITVSAGFRRAGAQPRLSHLVVEGSEGYKIRARWSPDFGKLNVKFWTPSGIYQRQKRASRIFRSSRTRAEINNLWFEMTYGLISHTDRRTKKVPRREYETIRELLGNFGRRRELRPYALAPVRSRPSRTYDPVDELPGPEGAHIPMVLARTFFRDRRTWRSISKALADFGSASGLFKDVSIRPLGKGEGDPFQISIKIAGPASNLVDVGYGVSQVLPILVDVLRNSERRTFLLQQPEVHLHPRAQSELGTFLGTLAKSTGKMFLVETHSDHLIDRIRMDVRDGKESRDGLNLKPEDVSILYFERRGSEVEIYSIELDTEGNLIGAPDSYRKFFLNEERRFLGA